MLKRRKSAATRAKKTRFYHSWISTKPADKKGSKAEKKGTKVSFYETWTFLILFCVVLPIMFRTFFYSPFHIPSGSMKPNLLIGDYIFVSKFSYGYSRYSLPFGINLIEGRIMEKDKPQRGDVIVFKQPKDTSIDYIKRLVGLPGDRIQVRNGLLYINGEQVKRECVEDFIDEVGGDKKMNVKQCIETMPNGVSYKVLDQDPEGALDNTSEYEVPPGHYFFMGDNRDNSQDSRVMSAVGYVPEINLVGRAEVIFFSLNSSIFRVDNWPHLIRKDRFCKKIK